MMITENLTFEDNDLSQGTVFEFYHSFPDTFIGDLTLRHSKGQLAYLYPDEGSDQHIIFTNLTAHGNYMSDGLIHMTT